MFCLICIRWLVLKFFQMVLGTCTRDFQWSEDLPIFWQIHDFSNFIDTEYLSGLDFVTGAILIHLKPILNYSGV